MGYNAPKPLVILLIIQAILSSSLTAGKFLLSAVYSNGFKGSLVYNVTRAFVYLIGAIFGVSPVIDKRFWINIFYYFDCFLNAVSGGNWNVSISARLGRFHLAGGMPPFEAFLWRISYNAVEKSFYVLDKNYHCENAYNWVIYNVSTTHVNRGPILGVFLLSVFAVVGAILLYPTIRILKFFNLL